MKGLIRPLKGLIRPFKGLIRHFKSLIRPLKGLSGGNRGGRILEEVLLEGLLGHIKAQVLVMSASSGAYS